MDVIRTLTIYNPVQHDVQYTVTIQQDRRLYLRIEPHEESALPVVVEKKMKKHYAIFDPTGWNRVRDHIIRWANSVDPSISKRLLRVNVPVDVWCKLAAAAASTVVLAAAQSVAQLAAVAAGKAYTTTCGVEGEGGACPLLGSTIEELVVGLPSTDYDPFQAARVPPPETSTKNWVWQDDLKVLDLSYIPTSACAIHVDGFHKCYSLHTVKLGPAVVTICKDAFTYSKLETIDIPPSVKYIGAGAFAACTHFKEGGCRIQGKRVIIYTDDSASLETIMDRSNRVDNVLVIHNDAFAYRNQVRGDEVKTWSDLRADYLHAPPALPFVPDAAEAPLFYWMGYVRDLPRSFNDFVARITAR
jgi:hypothetical protein